jgi:hypothetical protein
LLFCCGSHSFAQSKGADLVVKIIPVFGNSPMEFGSKYYLTGNKDSVKINLLRFYFSALCLKGKANSFNEKESYHLIDFDEKEFVEFKISNVKEGAYDQLQFSIGVDSVKNTAGALEGDLDPAKGMYWAWNTGYVAAKLEGASPSCKTKDRAFEFHVGGYRSPYNSYRSSQISIPELKIEKNKTNELVLMIDLSVWFNKLKLAETNHVVEPDNSSMKIADNYIKMISVKGGELK